ncbi:uncharacterized protein PV07_08821 [Cladophialophora immunda]|uniref:Uncharacterized protein n=1 Tax=Cladophialophora immunda TaxID=569365 RepID=A0A0D2C5B2_9EURO|nr:uncharacterized protein PV07_08821 [Cladophialophora immunda]KIW25660.1 hypothetical protein PV07_08821 [Cladophialophora immunda]
MPLLTSPLQTPHTPNNCQDQDVQGTPLRLRLLNVSDGNTQNVRQHEPRRNHWNASHRRTQTRRSRRESRGMSTPREGPEATRSEQADQPPEDGEASTGAKTPCISDDNAMEYGEKKDEWMAEIPGKRATANTATEEAGNKPDAKPKAHIQQKTPVQRTKVVFPRDSAQHAALGAPRLSITFGNMPPVNQDAALTQNYKTEVPE